MDESKLNPVRKSFRALAAFVVVVVACNNQDACTTCVGSVVDWVIYAVYSLLSFFLSLSPLRISLHLF